MKPAKVRAALGVGVVVGLAGWAVLDAWEGTGAPAPPTPWTATVAIALLAIVVLVSGFEVRRWVAGRRERPLDPLMAARIAVLAKAAVYAGAGFAGWYLAQAAVLLPDVVGQRRTRLVIALLSATAAVVLSVSGFVVQIWCRRPPHEDDGTDDEDADD